jgi:hypothetical protein
MILILLIKNVAILMAVIWFCWTVYGFEVDHWKSAREFGVASGFFLIVASCLVWFFSPPSGWRIFYLVEYSWTFAGDITVLLISLGYAFGLLFVGRLLRSEQPDN